MPICPTPLCRDRGDRVIWCAAWPLYLNQHRKQKKRSEGFRPLESVEEARPKSYVDTATPVGWPWSDNVCYAASTRTAQTLLLALLFLSLVYVYLLLRRIRLELLRDQLEAARERLDRPGGQRWLPY